VKPISGGQSGGHIVLGEPQLEHVSLGFGRLSTHPSRRSLRRLQSVVGVASEVLLRQYIVGAAKRRVSGAHCVRGGTFCILGTLVGFKMDSKYRWTPRAYINNTHAGNIKANI
jgi:hypothetical protein